MKAKRKRPKRKALTLRQQYASMHAMLRALRRDFEGLSQSNREMNYNLNYAIKLLTERLPAPPFACPRAEIR